MKPIDYKSLLEQAFAEYAEMILSRQALDLDIAKKKQFIKATMNMLPDEDRAALDAAVEKIPGEPLGLTDAIRQVLQQQYKKPFTATDVRDKLKHANFDFSSYKTNPLASIHAVLKRLKPEEVEATDIDGVAAWRWVGEIPNTTEWMNLWLKPSDARTHWNMFTGQIENDKFSNLKALLGTMADEKKVSKKGG
jgi:hypothetical protein